MTWKESVISEAATMLNSNEFTIQIEAANYPNHEAFYSMEQSLQRAAQSLVWTIRKNRQDEVNFFMAHPELNP